MKPAPSSDLMELLAEPFEGDLARAHTLPARWYTAPEMHALELERIFARTWQPVGRAAQVAHAGDYFTAEVAGRPVVVVRDEGGELRAFYNVCRHRAGPVAVGCGRRKSLQCAYHGWTYKLNGALATTPEFEGVECFDRAEHALRPVQVARWGPFVFVNLDANAGSLLELLGGIPAAAARFDLDAMTYTDRREWTFDCNWKVYMDNYHEGYHLPMVHPGLFREVDYSRYETRIFPTYEQQDAPLRPKSPVKDADGPRMYDGNGEALYYGVFPNWMLNIYPDNISINVVVPVGVGRTHTLFEWYFRDPSKNESIARSIAFSEEIQEEDIRICLAVQKGLASGAYDRGRFCVKREAAVHHFQSLVRSHVTRE
jgi:choline monooxygenase